jgi:hypothetical protein
MVLGLRLARQSEIVSRPPLKILSTDTADPDRKKISMILGRYSIHIPGIDRMSRAIQERRGNVDRRLPHHCTGSGQEWYGSADRAKKRSSSPWGADTSCRPRVKRENIGLPPDVDVTADSVLIAGAESA